MTKYARGNAKKLAYVLASKTSNAEHLEKLAEPGALNYYKPQLATDAADLYEYLQLLEELIDDEEAIEKAIAKRTREEEAQ